MFPLKAADFISRGVEKGPALGAALAAAEETWIAAGFPEDPEELDAIAVSVAQKKCRSSGAMVGQFGGCVNHYGS